MSSKAASVAADPIGTILGLLSPPAPAAAAVVALSPTSFNFGGATLGSGGGETKITLTNSGTAAATITSEKLTGPDSDDWVYEPLLPAAATLTPGSTTTTTPQTTGGLCGTTVAAGASCVLVGLIFEPGGVAIRTAAFTVTGNFPTASVALTGLGTDGYETATAKGVVNTFSDAKAFGNVDPIALGSPIVGISSTGDDGGYYMVSSIGQVFPYGDAHNYGSIKGRLNRLIVGMAAQGPAGYWLVSSDGGVFTFGDDAFYGSTGAMRLNSPIVGMAATPDGGGYWLVASDGGIFSFGDAKFYGSTGGTRLNSPVVGMSVMPDGKGYWLVAADGGVFAFGNAAFDGSTGGNRLVAPIAGMTATPDGGGYWLVASDGGIFSFGDAPFYGSAVGQVSSNVVGITLDGGPTGQAEHDQPTQPGSTP
jgi:hypothetical protein